MIVGIAEESLSALIKRREHDEGHITDLQRRNTELLLENRALKEQMTTLRQEKARMEERLLALGEVDLRPSSEG